MDVESILIDQTKIGQAPGQLWSGDLNFAIELSFQLQRGYDNAVRRTPESHSCVRRATAPHDTRRISSSIATASRKSGSTSLIYWNIA